ncbi:hypothetical protein PV05_03330 [Exophiala xenobiotica]|uniref:Uncharacterized protein n=1 Tax=Exophiala xenobiotica TaxID=348802 RepID=A0A0D2C216_9EURO|nr:uncharacterized protein PV05_03330 [Exophiala xenobiotica]KIW58836.1 hypothetical protein PV05_03330 [Exophiala xenobiotica]
MPIRIRNSLNATDRARFQVYAATFESYIVNQPRHRVQVGERNHERMEVVEFEDAEITTAFHPSVSVEDSDPRPHVTVRLTNSALRQRNEWYTLHWRPEGQGPTLILPRRNNAASLANKRQRKKDKDQRRKERRRDDKKDKDKRGEGGSAATTGFSGMHS